MQQLPSSAFRLNEDTKIWLDGGHNEDAGRAISDTLQEFKKDGSVGVILCMMKHKDPKCFINTFIENVDDLYITQLPNEPSSLSTNELSEIIKEIHHTKTKSYKDAIELTKLNDPSNILITGSLYLAGHVLQDLENLGHN